MVGSDAEEVYSPPKSFTLVFTLSYINPSLNLSFFIYQSPIFGAFQSQYPSSMQLCPKDFLMPIFLILKMRKQIDKK